MASKGLSLGKAQDAEIVVVAGAMCTSDANLGRALVLLEMTDSGRKALTVEVISLEQISQINFTPPSAPRAAVFLRMTPIAAIHSYAPP
jgi:hypothetical protein